MKNSDYYKSVTTQYSLKDLKNAILTFTNKEQYKYHLEQIELNYLKMKSDRLSTDGKKAFALVLSYYTGYKDNSERSSRNTNVLIRGTNVFSITNKWSDGLQYYPVIYYITKALSSLPFY